MPNLDHHDRQLLRLLQKNAKISSQDLAEKLGLSLSPVWRRVRKLESSGIIDRYVTMLNPRKLGLNTMAYVHVSLMEHTEEAIAAFDRFVAEQDQVIECSSVTGADDYLLKVVAKDPEGLETFLMQKMLRLGIVRSSTTHFVLRQKKYSTELPLGLA
ncbi:MAG: Lrp/AsnC family transcriptional regulator [Paracoccaceae bacterium]